MIFLLRLSQKSLPTHPMTACRDEQESQRAAFHGPITTIERSIVLHPAGMSSWRCSLQAGSHAESGFKLRLQGPTEKSQEYDFG